MDGIFKNLEEAIKLGHENDIIPALCQNVLIQASTGDEIFITLKILIQNIIKNVDNLSQFIRRTENVLISVKNQKTLRTCFQVITYFGISHCLIPGLGLNLRKQYMPQLTLNDDEKYEILVMCTDFFTRCYEVPVLKNIILTFHLSDYLAALIQLAFAPLKKPGVYKNFTMTEEKYNGLNKDRQRYIEVYESLVSNCFQPMLMKELLVLQNVKEESPRFVKNIIAKEMSRRLICPGGLLSLIRCFLDSYEIDTGVDWKKIEMICKIVTSKHGNVTETEYLSNICNQLRQIFALNNTHYLITAVSCLVSLIDKYPRADPVVSVKKEVFQPFDCSCLVAEDKDPGTIILTAQEIEHNILILHVSTCTTKLEVPMEYLSSNIFLLFSLSIRTSNKELKNKIDDIILKILESQLQNEIDKYVSELLFDNFLQSPFISVEEYNGNLLLKCVNKYTHIPVEDKISFLMNIFQKTESTHLTEHLLMSFLQLLVDLSNKRKNKPQTTLLSFEDHPVLLNDYDEKYAGLLLLLTDVSSLPKTVNILKTNPSIAISFVEKLLLMDDNESGECQTIGLVLLNVVLTNSNKTDTLKYKLKNLNPILKKCANRNDENSLLCKEILMLINNEFPQAQKETEYGKALSNVFDNLLPVRAHGIMELTKLIETSDPETISKRHYLFCLFQEQLKDSDSYVYLAAINALASLATHCTEDVLGLLCKEFLKISSENIKTVEDCNKIAEMRMKVGDIVVKVTRNLGEIAIKHKTILLNTFLCGCRDIDPLIRTSALSNLAEISRVLHYRVGTIIYEILLCVWSIIESDKAIECRRAAVMVISSLLKGLGRDTLIELKDNLLPIYRTLNKLYKDENEDSTVRLHSQIALEELNDIVKDFLFAKIPMQKDFQMPTESIKEIKFK